MKQNHSGRGSVSRRLRYSKRVETDQEFHKKLLETIKRGNLKRKKKINKRCVECNKLIGPTSTRCRSCESIRKINETWKRRRKDESLSNNVSSRYSNKKYFPTLQIALDLKIDENDFEATRILLEQQITNAKPAVEIKEEEKKQE